MSFMPSERWESFDDDDDLLQELLDSSSSHTAEPEDDDWFSSMILQVVDTQIESHDICEDCKMEDLSLDFDGHDCSRPAFVGMEEVVAWPEIVAEPPPAMGADGEWYMEGFGGAEGGVVGYLDPGDYYGWLYHGHCSLEQVCASLWE